MHTPFERRPAGRIVGAFAAAPTSPNQLRWNPLPLPTSPTDFVQGIVTMAGNGDPAAQSGAAAHLYVANRSMKQRAFYNADGEMLIVPQQGRQRFVTELGVIDAEPQEIVVIPRGVRFRVELLDDVARGYICENFGAAFKLPDLGPIGSNGLANPRDFMTPVAFYEDIDEPYELVGKFLGELWSAQMDHSPIDVVAWHEQASTPFPGGIWTPGDPTYGSKLDTNIPVTMSDGAVLMVDVSYPTDLATGARAPGPFPVLLTQIGRAHV